MHTEINTGDIVKLKSGGPKMTVSHRIQEGKVAMCYWYNLFGERCFESFRVECLEKIK